MRWLLLVLPLIMVAVPQDGHAKRKRGRAAKAEPLPPLPEPTALSLEFTAESDEEKVFDEASAQTAETDVTASTSTEASITWTLGDWRKQMQLDVARMSTLREAMALRLVEAYNENFTVAIRYLKGLYQTSEQLQSLGQTTYDTFNEETPLDRDMETSMAPPASARRVRLYLSKIESLDKSAVKFLERTVEGRTEKIVRVDSTE